MTSQEQITTGLARIGAVLRSQAWQHSGTLGVTPTQGQILVLLCQRGPLRVGQVAAQLGFTQPSASEGINTLVARGLLERHKCPGDGRATMLSVTAQGRQVAQAAAQWPDAFMGALDVLDEQERAALLKVLVKVIRQLQVQQVVPTQRVCATCVHFRPNVHGGQKPHHCNFLGTAFGDGQLRTDCTDHKPADQHELEQIWFQFNGQDSKAGMEIGSAS